MMPDKLTLADLVATLGPRMGLTYVHGQKVAADRILPGTTDSDLPLAGHLNLIRPNRIQVIGDREAAYIESLGPTEHEKLIHDLAATGTAAVIFAEGTCPFEQLPAHCPHPLPVILCTSSSSHEVIALLRYFLQQRLAHTAVRHGVFMEILGAGVLISGDSSVGKSEVALELVSRGHRLIADDAPEFARIAPDIIRGTCPPLLRDLLEVRGLGVLNIRAMYGDSAIKRGKYLRLIIDLRDRDRPPPVPDDRLTGCRGEIEILGLRIPLVSLPVAPGRNIAVMIEAAVRAHLLHLQGYVAGDDLRTRQRLQMQSARSEQAP
ncbi:HPr kinase/phosphorylase [Thioalkalivibrio nitratireducens DSM 14787]|uniref:HPr kinase/phosphorylase n=1 Tax=Thioalkalivibrio nitratireducens (strain DSM 14787 / UNIQEM 213 / ALEN2) TaxID=1255043 RepID=L0E0V5_THIND|nr:HPr(Ser) kinase/phosphatase [Thioalkalivibrio nitratireducens]AGA34286.1 HPr kinase/phosphorylase [Thioalkalivibrio nitratireducens DSM 14787]